MSRIPLRHVTALLFLTASLGVCRRSDTCGEGDLILKIPCHETPLPSQFRIFYTTPGGVESEFDVVNANCPETRVLIETRGPSSRVAREPIDFRIQAIASDGRVLKLLAAQASAEDQCVYLEAKVNDDDVVPGNLDAGMGATDTDKADPSQVVDGEDAHAEGAQMEDAGSEDSLNQDVADPNSCEPLDVCGLQCVDKKIDKNNCGSCGLRCNYPNGVGVCEGGTCKLMQCMVGYADCSNASGCETPLGTSANCKSCGDACSQCSDEGCKGVGWATQWGSTEDDVAAAVATNAEGNIVVAGYTNGSLFGPNKGEGDAFVTMLNRDGSVRWTWQWGSPADDRITAVAVDQDGNILAAGTTSGTISGPSAGGGRCIRQQNQRLWTANLDEAMGNVIVR